MLNMTQNAKTYLTLKCISFDNKIIFWYIFRSAFGFYISKFIFFIFFGNLAHFSKSSSEDFLSFFVKVNKAITCQFFLH